ncbi:unnamed protein product [Adineta ricciae]|uniref:UNC93-like protein n=1 Tax=Adineta ricciae TaxID=249248 RepID=A0A815J990_ADIRI|nr:unnamed protein product [Adineta ricciae]CAF1559610.1 unnamed protein product [Adineta ricciae]
MPINPNLDLETSDNPNVISMDERTMSKKQRPFDFRTLKNILAISFAFLLQFTAFNGMGNLQSSLNTEANVGVNSLSIIYVFLIFSSIFLPHPLMAILGLKWTLIISQVPYLLFMAANYYPKAYLMYPAAVLVGLAAAPLWTSKCSYLTNVGTVYANEKNLDKTAVINRFFGIFFMFFQSCQIWGNLISYLILTPENRLSTNATSKTNTSLVGTIYEKCGADFSEQEYQSTEVANKIDRKTVDILCIIYVCLCISSIFLLIFLLDQRRTASRDKVPVMIRSSVKLLVSTLKHMRHIDQILLIPMSIWCGLELTYVFTIFTKAFVSCTFSAKYVGLVMIAFGICDSVGSFVFGQLVKVVGRWPCFAIAAAINYALMITMLIWHPSSNQIVVLFIIAGLWGVADSVWQSQTSALYGVLFNDTNEAAFSNYRLWESAGFAFFYIITPYARTRIILIILLSFLTVGISGYIIIEYRCRKHDEQKVKKQPSTSTQSFQF